ncbi:MAG TPA: preprotein translocase subunit SecA [Candidatus Paceibacterota bacterium]|jgi:preprotein translocase subunit SecA|nr:preprotein translocase subunit SecA [Candidatus Paceibacterota bacterium]
MLGSIKKFFTKRSLGALEARVTEVNALEPELQKLSDEELKAESAKLKERLAQGETLEDIASCAFALAREAARRTLNQRAFDVQLLGGFAIHEGSVAEMMTGEGKTLAGVAPAYLNALAGKGVHVVTVNEYLARRDAVWMGQVYRALGLTVGVLVPNAAFMYDPLYKAPEEGSGKAAQNPEESKLLDKERDTTGAFLVQQEFLRPAPRRDAYAADITYGTNHEFGFDYLRDNLIYRVEDRVQRGHNFAIIDEVDSILIDEARTPLIIAAPDQESSDAYKAFARVVTNLNKDEDYDVDEKRKSVAITDAGVEKVEKMLNIPNIYAPENIRLVHYLEESLKAKALFQRDKDYVVKNGEVIIVDEFTGRMLVGRRYQAGLHQAIEAKENVRVKEESRTYAKISIQNYFRMYKKISGMTGTAQTSAEEFHKVYELEVVSIPPNKPLARKDLNDLIYKNFSAKVKAVVREVGERHKKGQPVLLGTTSIAKNEIFSAALSQAGIPHEVLNAKNNEREGAIIAQAGRTGGVTVATNVAGRGVDILLGGNPPTPEEGKAVREHGGLHVIGTERHEARRIDNQLRGRSGRQGDPGSTQFFLSAEDDLLRIFGGDRMKSIMERFDVPEDEPLEFKFVTSAVEQAQEKVEGANFDLRKHLLDYDDVLNKQRAAVYRRRTEMLGLMNREDVAKAITDAALAHFDAAVAPELDELAASDMSALEAAGVETDASREAKTRQENILKMFRDAMIIDASAPLPATTEDARKLIEERSAKAAENPLARNQLLGTLDMLWMTNLEDLEALQESVGLRAYGQKDPLVEYRQEASRLFKNFWASFNGLIFANTFKLASDAAMRTATTGNENANPNAGALRSSGGGGAAAGTEKIGRNDPCPCGSGKKWKKCGLLDTEEHRRNMAQKANPAAEHASKPKHEVTGG